MRTIAHLSDLHFGRTDPEVLEPLLAAVATVNPDVVAVSGDLTQRARESQFIQARAFLDRLPSPQIVIPGNHDVPLYDVMRRFVAPLARFRRHVTAEREPFYQDDEIAIVGISTARSLTFKGGRINIDQVESIASRFSGLDPSVVRVLVTHHPFDVPAHVGASELVGRASMAMRAFAEAGVDLFLSGHLHHSHHSNTAERYGIDGHAALVVQSGTSTSTRGRGEANAFNVIRVSATSMTVEVWNWQRDRAAFLPGRISGFRRSPTGWSPEPAG
ncbi:metallophosphoesterase family protein [Cognatiluteimonas profundi]|uniref:metallophosphoesterase family protein n=1 Tax=Cognatiluteimonas profundi TaxID=2594501 RepID=UPI00131BD8A5|nr:metallophosphoesterase [Lysobacter profundi]